MSEPPEDLSSADRGAAEAAGWWHPRSVLTPPACAIAALVLAFATLSGQNLLLVGIQALFGEGAFRGNDIAGYYVLWGLAAFVPLVAVGLLVRVPLTGKAHTWEVHVARAAVIVAAVAAAGAVLTALGGALHGR